MTHGRTAPAVPAGVCASLVLGVMVLTTVPAQAQSREAGAILVRVLDSSGEPVAGAGVVLWGALGSRSRQTDASGTARFPNLEPGVHVATASRDGWQPVSREGLLVSAGQTLTIRITLSPTPVDETVVVRGESPMIDFTRAWVGANYGAPLIDQAPTAAGLWEGILAHIPGVVIGGFDPGGTDATSEPEFSARGVGFDQNSYNLNGSNVTDLNFSPVTGDPEVGRSLMYYSIYAFQEVSVSTGAHDIETQVPGVAINMVTKTGSNDWAGGGKFFYEGESFVARNVDEELEDRGAAEGNPNKFLREIDLQVGGPIVRDRAWFFVDYYTLRHDRLIVGVPADEGNHTELDNWSLNGSVKLADDHRLQLRYFTNRRFEDNAMASSRRPPSHVPFEDAFIDVPQVQYQGVLGPETFAEVRFSSIDHDNRSEAKHPDSAHPHPEFVDKPPTIDRQGFTFSGWPEWESFTQRSRTQFGGNLTRYLTAAGQSHDIKLGATFADTEAFEPGRMPFGVRQYVIGDEAESVHLSNSTTENIFSVAAPRALTLEGKEYSFFAQDTWMIDDRLTVTIGVRYDRTTSASPAQLRAESHWPELGPDFQEEAIPAVDPATDWTTWVPRISAVYDLLGDGTTAVKGSYARYSFQQGVQWPLLINPNTHGFEVWTWEDANGDLVFQSGEQAVLQQRWFQSSRTEIDPEFDSPISQEVTVGLERQVRGDLLFSATYIHRSGKNHLDDINVGNPWGPLAARLGAEDPFTPIGVTDPGPDGVLGTPDDGGALTIYSLDPEAFGRARFLISNPARFGFETFDRYNGVSLVVQKRWSGNWQMLASWDIGRAESYSGQRSNTIFGGALDNPNNDVNRAGLSPWDRTHLVKVTGNYVFAEPIGVNLGVFWRLESGAPLTRLVDFRSRDVEGLNQNRVRVRATPPGEDTIGGERLDTVNIVDVRAEKRFTVGRYGLLHIYADVFNLFNTNAVTRQGNISGVNFERVFNLVPPRVFRIGVGWDY